MVGLGRFELPSRAPEAQSLDHASRQPLVRSLDISTQCLPFIIKTLTKLQHLSKANQRAIWYRLQRLSREVNLQRPAEVEKFVYSMNVKNNYKNKLFAAYQHFCHANTILYRKPKRLTEEPYVIHIPTEQRIDKIIACCGRVYSVVFSISKYGLRPDEISKLTFRNVDLQNRKLTIPTSKLGAQRTLQLKKQTIEILREYINRKGITSPNEKLFGSTRKVKETWRKYRSRAYTKFKDPELLKIRLYDLRHWFATTTYMKTRDIFYVKYALGHRRIENTMIYIHLAKALTNDAEDYICKTAKTVEEARKLIEAGFEYVTEFEGVKLFRKRK